MLWFILGLVVGGMIGTFCMALFQVSKKEDDDAGR